MRTPAPVVMEPIDTETCLELLATQVVGRLAYVLDGEPRIVPMNYAMHEGSVVFRTSYGDLLDAVHRADVAFEVDHAESARTGWSVIVQGVAEEIWEPENIDEVEQLPLRAWAPGHRDHYVRIRPNKVTGRRIA